MPPKKTRSTLQGDLLPGDFTPGQYILGICIALFFGLSCFGLGIVIGRREPAAPGAQARPAVSAPVATAKKAEGVQTSPRRPESLPPSAGTEPRRPTLPPSAGAAPEAPASAAGASTGGEALGAAAPGTVASTGSGVVVRPGRDGVTVTPQTAATPEPVASAPSPGATAPSSGGSGAQAVSPVASAAVPTAPAKPGVGPSASVPSASTSKAPVATATPVTPPEDAPKKPAAGSGAAPVSPAGAASKPDTTGAAATAGGKWGIQVASLSGAARQKGADDLIRRLRETAGLTAQAIPTADGAALRVVVVGFGTREAADTACKELKQKPEFKGAFVKPL